MLIFQEKWLSVAIYDKSDFHLYFSTIFVSNLWSEVIAPFTHIIIIALQLFFFTVYVCYPLWYDIESGRIQSSEGIRGFISNCNCLSVFSSYIIIIFIIAAFSRLPRVYNLVRAFKIRWKISVYCSCFFSLPCCIFLSSGWRPSWSCVVRAVAPKISSWKGAI